MSKTLQLCLLSFLSATGAATFAQGSGITRLEFRLEPQPLPDAVAAWAQQAGYHLVWPVDDAVVKRMAPRVAGHYGREEALRLLLAGSGLTYSFVNSDTVAIRPEAPSAGRRSSEPMNLARSGVVADEAHSPGKQAPPAAMEEVVVTAQKREERLQDVPIPVTALSADSLVSSNQLRIQDYYTRIPGLSYTPGSFGEQFLVIRGIATGGSSSANPIVGVTVDDVPYGSSTGLGGGGFGIPDIDPSELSRVEVLRGPQGTLYGASSLGGLIKYVTVDPSMERVSGRIQAGLSEVTDGDSLGYHTRGSINVPLSETAAIRASGFHRDDPGYIDNSTTGQDDVNKNQAYGGRISLLLRATENLSIKLGALLQHDESDGYAFANPALGDLLQSFPEPLKTVSTRAAYSAVMNAQVGVVDVTSVTGYNIDKSAGALDFSFFLTPALNQSQFGISGTGATSVTTLHTEKFSQELRVATPLGRRIQGVLGAFYTHEDSPLQTQYLAVDPTGGAAVARWLNALGPIKFEEYALFTNLTFLLADRLDLQIGVRQSWNELNSDPYSEGPYNVLFGGGASIVDPASLTSDDDAFTYLFTPRLTISANLMVYARFASGYRAGAPNQRSGNVNGTNISPLYSPDTTESYEIGTKGELLQGAISIDASVYYIDWKDIQLQLREPVSRLTYFSNAGHATSQGVELSLLMRPTSGLTLTAWGAYNDASLKEAFPVTGVLFGAEGDRLPYSSRLSAHIAADQKFSITDNVAGYLGFESSYVGARMGVFRGATLARQVFPSYVKFDLHAGIIYDAWRANLFINNVANKRGVLNGGLGFTYPTYLAYIPPRTIGLSISKEF